MAITDAAMKYPVREITFAFLSAGVMSQAQNIERFQRICDIVTSAAI